MAVMEKMRKNMAAILFFLLVMFVASMTIGGLVGGADILDIISGRKPDTILKVNGEEVKYEQFTNAYNAELEAFRQKNDQEPQSYQIQQIENQVWESLIQQILTRQMIEKLGIDVTREEVRYFIFDNPHAIFRMDQNFWNENKEFDLAKFQAALNSPGNDVFWKRYEEYLKYLIPNEKLEYQILSTIRLTEEELRQEFARKNQHAKVSYIFFDPNKYKIADDQILENEIAAYYKQHSTDYQEDEKRKIKFVVFDTSPSSKDSAETLKLAESILADAKTGEDFTQLAETYSDDPGSAAKGGDLGYFGRGAMVKPFEDAAFSAGVGEIVGPVKSNFGLHIIKIEDKKTEAGEEKVSARHILVKYKSSRETQENARNNAEYFADRAQDEGFDKVALTEKLKVDSTDFFTNTGFIPKLGMEKRIASRAFNMKRDEVSKVNYIENKGYFIFQLVDIKKAGFKSLDEVRATIVSKIRQEKQMQKAGEAARAVREKMHLPEDFERVANEDSLEIKQTNSFTLEGSVTGVGSDPKFSGTSFALDVLEISKPVEGTRGYYVIRLDEKETLDENEYAMQRESLKNQLLDTKRRAIYNLWLTNLKEQADIKDYRYMFF